MKRFSNFSDSEPSILAVKDAAARITPICELHIPESCPVGDHQSHGSTEESVRALKKQMRAVRMQTQEHTWCDRQQTMTHSCSDSNFLGRRDLTISTKCRWSRQSLEFGGNVFV